MKALTAIILDTRKALKGNKKNPDDAIDVKKEPNKYPVKLRVTFNRLQRYYPADLSLTEAEFAIVRGSNPKGNFKKWKLNIDALEQKANMIIEDMLVFDFTLFKRYLHSDQMVRDDVYAYYEKMIAAYKQKGQIGTAANYNCSLVSLKKFKNKLTFIDVTVDFLEKYEADLLKKNKSVTTIGIYLRPLRSVINHAMAEGILSKNFNYPFGSKSKNKFQIPTSRNIKKALTLAEIKLLYNYKAKPDSWEEKALDFWLFSYLANGMNMKDIANLRYKDIDGEYIKFIRAKTRNTNHIVTPITIYLTDDLKRIIEKWGNQDKSPETLIFSIIDPNSTPEKQMADLHQFIKMVNKYMGIIAKSKGINKPCTTYYARHSFSTVLKRSGANVQFISEALGHSSISTTKAYLDSFEDDTKKEMAKALTDFK